MLHILAISFNITYLFGLIWFKWRPVSSMEILYVLTRVLSWFDHAIKMHWIQHACVGKGKQMIISWMSKMLMNDETSIDRCAMSWFRTSLQTSNCGCFVHLTKQCLVKLVANREVKERQMIVIGYRWGWKLDMEYANEKRHWLK